LLIPAAEQALGDDQGELSRPASLDWGAHV